MFFTYGYVIIIIIPLTYLQDSLLRIQSLCKLCYIWTTIRFCDNTKREIMNSW